MVLEASKLSKGLPVLRALDLRIYEEMKPECCTAVFARARKTCKEMKFECCTAVFAQARKTCKEMKFECCTAVFAQARKTCKEMKRGTGA